MRTDVVVTGYGVLTAFGYGPQAIMENVFAGVAGFRRVTRFDTAPYRCHQAAESDEAASQREVALTCARAALEMAGLEGPVSAAVLLGTCGDFTGINAFWRRTLAGTEEASPGSLPESIPGHLADAVGRELGLSGRRLAFNNGCVASSNAIIHGCQLIASGREEVALCGGCYLVDEEFFAKFDSGRAFAKDGRLRAFSAERSGLLLGDGGAVLVLESAERVARRRARPLARIEGWGMAADAYHVCQPHPQGAGLAAAIEMALAQAGLGPNEVGYVNAHGTGTVLNDVAETRALKAAFGERATRLPVSSTKTTTGHVLEAAGALETVISMLALEHGLIPPTAGYTTLDPACDLDCVPNRPRRAVLEHVISTSSAFGGVNTALLLAGA